MKKNFEQNTEEEDEVKEPKCLRCRCRRRRPRPHLLQKTHTNTHQQVPRKVEWNYYYTS